MRKALSIAAVAVLGVALVVALRSESPSPSSPSEDSAPHSPAPRVSPALRDALRAAVRPAVVVGAGELAGTVLGPGHGGAKVVLSGNGLTRVVTASADGAFHFAGLSAGAYRLDASTAELSAETLGPIPLGEGEQIRGLDLQLSAAGALSGVVLDAQSREPVVGAELSAGGASAQSDAQGHFTLRGMPPGAVSLLITRAGYVASTTQVAVPRGSAQQGAVLMLSRAAHLTGKVTLADHTPVGGAQIIARRYHFGAIADAQALTQSDAQGAFAADVTPGRLTVLASLGSSEGHAPELEIAPGETRTVELVLDVAGEISGSVLEPDGKPSPGAGVVAVELQTQRASPPAQTDSEGRFRLTGLPEGVYAVVARSGERSAEVSGLRLQAGDGLTAELRLGAGAISGTVLDAAGQPFPGAEVSVIPEGGAALALSTVRSGAAGRFRVEGLAGTHFVLRATSGQGTAERHGVQLGGEVVLRLLRPSAIVGVVADASGHPVSDFEVLADPDGPLTGSAAARAMGHFASVEGSFRLEVAPGRYRVRVAAPGFLNSELVAAEAPQQGEGAPLRFTVRQGARVSGVVLDAATHQPIAGAQVSDSPNRLFAYGRSAPLASGSSTLTDATGHFALEVDTSRPGGIWARADGYDPAYRAVAAGAGTPEALELRPVNRPSVPDFAGVGMQIGPNFTIPVVFESGPAYLAGVREGDRLVSVDGREVAGHPLDEVVGWIRGEVGTAVALGIQRGGESGVLVATRAEIKF